MDMVLPACEACAASMPQKRSFNHANPSAKHLLPTSALLRSPNASSQHATLVTQRMPNKSTTHHCMAAPTASFVWEAHHQSAPSRPSVSLGRLLCLPPHLRQHQLPAAQQLLQLPN